MGVSHDHNDTIVAIASPSGSAVRGIVRVSGPNTLDCFRQNFSADESPFSFDTLSEAHCVAGSLQFQSETIPGNLLLWPTERSFTRQPSAEFHTFGSRPVLELVVKAVCEAGARPAQPGEFTMRAFLSGRLDLTQAEAVLAVIDAKNRKQLDVAIDQLAGGIGSKLTNVRTELVGALAELEAGLDFVEEDIEFISNDAMIAKLEAACESLSRVLSQLSSRDHKNDTFRVSLFGLPNAGKSSLFNRLVGRDLAIVSATKGTTTDRVSAKCTIGEHDIELIDTAGLESVDGELSIAAVSQNHRIREIQQCDFALLCISSALKRAEMISQLEQLKDFATKEAAVVLTQTDRLTGEQTESLLKLMSLRAPEVSVVSASSVEGEGTSNVASLIQRVALESQIGESAIVGSTMLRTEQSLNEASDSILSALDAARNGLGDEIIAAEVRAALDSIGLIVGTIYTDDILDVVFGQFCIGK